MRAYFRVYWLVWTLVSKLAYWMVDYRLQLSNDEYKITPKNLLKNDLKSRIKTFDRIVYPVS